MSTDLCLQTCQVRAALVFVCGEMDTSTSENQQAAADALKDVLPARHDVEISEETIVRKLCHQIILSVENQHTE